MQAGIVLVRPVTVRPGSAPCGRHGRVRLGASSLLWSSLCVSRQAGIVGSKLVTSRLGQACRRQARCYTSLQGSGRFCSAGRGRLGSAFHGEAQRVLSLQARRGFAEPVPARLGVAVAVRSGNARPVSARRGTAGMAWPRKACFGGAGLVGDRRCRRSKAWSGVFCHGKATQVEAGMEWTGGDGIGVAGISRHGTASRVRAWTGKARWG
jgi:hypothetical protein